MSTVPPLAPHESAHLTEFARACKAAARAVVLYPGGHPTITSTLARIAQITSTASLTAPLQISVTGDELRLDGRAPARPDPALAELAAMLHAHLIGELVVNPGGDVEAWRSFLLLLGREPETVRADGGIGHLWATMAGRHVALREIDYTEVLRERRGGFPATWEDIVASCLQGRPIELNEDTVRTLLDITGDADRMAELVASIETRELDAGANVGRRTAALLRLLGGIVASVKRQEPDRLDLVLQAIASAIGQLSPDVMVALLAERGREEDEPGLIDAVVSRMSDDTIAQFVARHAIDAGPSIDRVAQAFHALVGGSEQQERLLALAHDRLADSPLGATEQFEETWDEVAQKLLTSYSDKPFVSDPYAHELSTARERAVAVDVLNEDPPERVAAWLGTVATSQLRRLDLTLVLDLMQIEDDPERRATLVTPVVALLEDLLLVGDFEAADELVAAVVKDAQASAERRAAATSIVDRLVAGPIMQHIVAHLAAIDDERFERVKAMCVSLGEVLVRPLAETLSAEERTRPRERLTAILIAFGAIGRREVERLKGSPNPAVRRTAIYLLREFGGSEALPELTELLNDSEPQVQREAVRAILNIGTERAYSVLEQALTRGTGQSREAIMHSLGAMRDERAAPLFAYVLRHVDHRGSLRTIYLHAIERLGSFKGPEGVKALEEALYRGEWWAPRRTALLRRAAAASLARIGTPEADRVLEEAVTSGTRGVRSTARAIRSGSR